MCFSASASFIASGGLALIGGGSLLIAKKEDKLLAVIPLLFAAQQALEGAQWLYINSGTSSLPVGYSYLFFAFIVWPIYVPTFVYILDKKKRSILKYFIFLGSLTALYFASILFTQSLHIVELKSCISYDFNVPLNYFINLSYLISIFAPLFISSHRELKWFGAVTAVSFAITWIFFSLSFASVWCFFAAVISSMFFVYIKRKNKIQKET